MYLTLTERQKKKYYKRRVVDKESCEIANVASQVDHTSSRTIVIHRRCGPNRVLVTKDERTSGPSATSRSPVPL